MSTTTKNLGLLKKDPVQDASDVFNLKTMLNENWDKIDEEAERVRQYADDANKMFIAVYGVTTYEELQAAYAAGKTLMLRCGDRDAPFYQMEGTSFTFSTNGPNTYNNYWCTAAGVWGSRDVSLLADHAKRHISGGADPLTPEDIGAAKVTTGSYVGTWTSSVEGANLELHFDVLPKIIFIAPNASTNTAFAILFTQSNRGITLRDADNHNIYTVSFETSENKIVIKNDTYALPLGRSGTTYNYVGIA